MTRPDREGWLLGIAAAVGAIADCRRRTVGAVLYDPRSFHVLSTGYNGRAAGVPGCLTAGACPRGHSDVPTRSDYFVPGSPGSCDAIHAEDNALRRARERNIDVTGAHCAVTCEPCQGCYALLRHYGIELVFWPGGRRELTP